MDYQIRLDNFEGPFDLLLHLIDINQVDIYDIPIAEIARQYLDYLNQMEALDLEIASSFLLMAANLLAIKARMLLPKPPLEENPEEDARFELTRDLLEYKRYKEASLILDDYYQKQALSLPRPNEEDWYLQLFAPENPLEGKTIDDLSSAFKALLAKFENQKKIMHIKGREITIGDKLEEIYQRLKINPHGLAFGAVFSSSKSKIEMVITFLALLELIKGNIIRVCQKTAFEEIYLYAHKLDKYKNINC